MIDLTKYKIILYHYPYTNKELEKIIKSISQYSKEIRNNAGGAFNHALFWNMLTPKEKKLKGDLLGKASIFG